jgi:3-keto-5-aminohexanoate cleavage enzyme
LRLCRHASPLIIEVAINGNKDKTQNPHVPRSVDEIVDDASACLAAGAMVIHAHADDAVLGSGGSHSPDKYAQAFRGIKARHPDAFLYPTLPGGGPGTSMAGRLAHVFSLAEQGLVELVPIDPGAMNHGETASDGSPPAHARIYQTTFEDAAWGFAECNRRSLACTIDLFEAGFVRLMDAHDRHGTLAQRAIVKLEFAAGRRLFGLPPTVAALDVYLGMFASNRLPWMVAVRDGDPFATGLVQAAAERGGHVRIGIEDHCATQQPRNRELVARVVEIAASASRSLAVRRDVLDALDASARIR